MEIILTDDVPGLGDIGENVRVRPGYARNFLIPRGFAIEAESADARQLAHKRLGVEAKKRRMKSDAEKKAENIRSLAVELQLRVGSSGRVFGSVSTKDVAEKLTEMGFSVDRRRVVIEEPIRKIGTHFVKVKLHSDVSVQVKIVVTPVQASAEEEAAAVQSVKENLEKARDDRDLDAPTEEASEE